MRHTKYKTGKQDRYARQVCKTGIQDSYARQVYKTGMQDRHTRQVYVSWTLVTKGVSTPDQRYDKLYSMHQIFNGQVLIRIMFRCPVRLPHITLFGLVHMLWWALFGLQCVCSGHCLVCMDCALYIFTFSELLKAQLPALYTQVLRVVQQQPPILNGVGFHPIYT